MLNTTEITNKIAQMKERYSNLFTIQTQEVITDLNQLTEIVEQAQAIQIKAKVEEPKQEIVEDQTHEVEQKEVILPFQTEIDNKIEWQKTREKEAKQFLKDNWVSNRKFLKGEKAINKAIELGFNW